jgi:hypothetical protein
LRIKWGGLVETRTPPIVGRALSRDVGPENFLSTFNIPSLECKCVRREGPEKFILEFFLGPVNNLIKLYVKKIHM